MCPVHQSSFGVPDIFAFNLHLGSLLQRNWFRKVDVVADEEDGSPAAPHRLDFGYVLARSWWGRGLMTEVLTEVVEWALSQPPFFRIGAVCDVENIGSARVMEKAGLTLEKRYWYKGTLEAVKYALDRDVYLGRRAEGYA
jgi:RimJ/RimL family protein N-acetyltransferase